MTATPGARPDHLADRADAAHQPVTDLASDLAADGDLDVTSWTALAALPHDMDVLAAQLASITRYARRWVCQREGFAPSPLCLWQPLGELMDVLADCFADLERVGVADWAGLRDGVVDTAGDLRAVDEWVADRMPVVA